MQKIKHLLKKTWQGVVWLFQKVKGFVVKHKVWTVIIALVLIAAIVFSVMAGKKKQQPQAASTEATVSRRSISDVVTGSSVILPNAEYTVTSLVTGEILEAPFEEGDYVEKDQLLYRFDSDSMENSITSSNLNLEKAQKNYNDALADAADLHVTAPISGTIQEVLVKKGDSVTNGTKIATIYNDSVMKAQIPFNAADAASIHKGASATLTLVGNGTVLYGTVTEVSSGSQTGAGHMLVSYVTIEVRNPGALTSSDSATAMIGGIACNDVGTFEPVDEYDIKAETAGTIDQLSISKGDHVSKGATVALLDSSTIDDQIYNAEKSLQDAQLSMEKLQDQLEDYTVTAPISGTVVTKNKKAGEKYEGNSGGSSSSTSSTSTGLAVIYDMSSLYFDLDVDELDVKKIAVGQSVTITADAVEGKTYSGTVENVSVNGTVGTAGVTTYPVRVRIADFDDQLLPGMNIEAEIAITATENALVVPVSAVNRGNTVYVKGEKTQENDRAPEGFYTVRVTTGVSDDSYIEILSGLNEGDVVYVTVQDTSEETMFPGMGGMPGGMGGGAPGGMGGAPGGMNGGGNRSGGASGGGNRSGGGMR